MVGSVSILTQYLESFTYAGLLLVLFLCGLGIPIPEDITTRRSYVFGKPLA